MLATLVGLGRHTVTGMLHTCGAGFQDWSAVYRLFSKARLDPGSLFAVTRRGVVKELDPAAPLVVAMDDSLLPKRGPTIPGVAWRRDPLGPPFHTNFIRAQRVLAISALPGADELGPARAIPVDYQHAPTPRRPRNLINASDQERKQYRQACRKDSMAAQGARRLQLLRQQLDQDLGSAQRPLEVVVDGRFTNCVVLRQQPSNTVLIGRVRKDAKLYHLPAPPPAAGDDSMASALRRRSSCAATKTSSGKRSKPGRPAKSIAFASRRCRRCAGVRPEGSGICAWW